MSSIAMDNVRFIELSETLGDYHGVVKKIRFFDESIRSSDDVEAKNEYLKVLARIQTALVYEQIHGTGSLLDLDSTHNQYKISIGLITAEQVAAARRHRGAKRSVEVTDLSDVEIAAIAVSEDETDQPYDLDDIPDPHEPDGSGSGSERMMAVSLMLAAMEYSERRRSYSTVVRMVEFYDDSIRRRGEPGELTRYAALTERIAPALEYEKQFGEGSLLDLDDPENISWIKAGIIKPWIVEAARRDRERIAVLNSTATPEAVGSEVEGRKHDGLSNT
jgi:hypothetical protein